MDRSNAGQRILNSKRTLLGAEDALENYIGRALQDGCQCFVLEEQANFRFLASCGLKPDGAYVVAPHGDNHGRWVRESGLVGFALLEGGKLGADGSGIFGGYTYQKLVQFEMTPEALVYVGAVPRVAQLSATSPAPTDLRILLLQGDARAIVSGQGSISGAALLHPGERIQLCTDADLVPGSGVANLQVILT